MNEIIIKPENLANVITLLQIYGQPIKSVGIGLTEPKLVVIYEDVNLTCEQYMTLRLYAESYNL